MEDLELNDSKNCIITVRTLLHKRTLHKTNYCITY
jgi:hypothetical protein